MNRKLVFMLPLTLLLGILCGVFNVQSVMASGTIYIRADGSIDPPNAPISTLDNVTYTLTNSINGDADGIVVERNNITIDGAEFTLQGSGSGNGAHLSGRRNVTIRNMQIKDFYCGIFLESSSNNTIIGNDISNAWAGIELLGSFNNSISGNDLTNNASVYLAGTGASNNTIYHNNFGDWAISGYPINSWDNGYPSGGNYWRYYTGDDFYSGPNQNQPGSDGIIDRSYRLTDNNTDNYPLMTQYIVPEFPSFLILPLFMIATLLAVIAYNRKQKRRK